MQIRKTVSGFWGKKPNPINDGKFEMVVGSNTGDADIEARMFGVGLIESHNSTRWFHLDINDVRAILKEHDERHKGEKTKSRKVI